MIDFEMFLEDFKEEITETIRACGLNKKERKAILSILGERLVNSRMDGIDMFNIFQEVCQSYMVRENTLDDDLLRARVDYAEDVYLDKRQDYILEVDPMTTFDTLEERGAILR